MANFNTPWNKGLKQSAEVLKAKRAEYYQKNKEVLKLKVKNNRVKKLDYYREYMRWQALKRKYGLTKDQYEFLYKSQDGKCAICEKSKQLVVDHCHISGKVRGLLCDGCNREMAIVDNPDKLAKAQRYKSESN